MNEDTQAIHMSFSDPRCSVLIINIK